MRYNKGIKVLTIIILILFLIATFGVVVLYLTSPDEEQQSISDPDTLQLPVTEPEIIINDDSLDIDPSTSLIPESEQIDVDLAPDRGDPVPSMDPVGDDPL